ncbi:MAG: hypothetical protein IH586_12285 [Anaerolineaceae bacterium]|nr:hypothetical protein [Anaerolineaceae bacterium]
MRFILLALGLLLLVIALVALSFAWTPVSIYTDRAPIAPTLFVLPPGGSP